MKVRGRLEGLLIDERIMLKCMLEKSLDVSYWLRPFKDRDQFWVPVYTTLNLRVP
jgi:hypothetical protein